MNLPFADNRAEEANMQLVAGGGINDGVMETPNNYSVPTECTVIRSRISTPQIIALVAAITNHQASSSNTMRRRGGRIRKKHLSEEELIERKRHVNMVVSNRRTIERKQLLSTYLKNKKRIERLTISIQLNTDRKGKPTSFFNVRKWEREKAASASIVHHIEVNNFKKMKNKKKEKKTPTHIYFE
ncbi:BnaA01g24110D [Brassica napus]|uniref:Uncharacterized protein n=2 Tax=Brassica TaxID=3705 RepID=A0A3P5ZES3_BRACM|nr:unnamed protein product [Brassica napus]CDY35501.1 BnaA01g24110D [Brassica napus]VDC76819.1 unnamed protein product [Brassica rapa]